MSLMSARKIAYNTIAQIAGKFLGFFISSFSLVIITEHLGTIGMGYYTTVTAFVGFFLILAELGFNTVMVREIAQNWEDRVRLTGEFLGLRIVFSLVVLGLAIPAALLFPQYRGLVAAGVGIAALTQFLLLANQIFVSVLQLNLQMDKAVISETINRLVTLGLYIVASRYIDDGTTFFFAVLWITAFAAAINLFVSYLFTLKLWPIRPVISLSRWRELMVLVIPMTVFSFLGVIHFKADTVILSLVKTPYEVGVYGYAYKIVEVMFTIPLMFLGVVFPRLSMLVVDDEAGFHALGQKTFEALLLSTVPFIIGIYLLAPYLTTMLSRQSLGDGLAASRALQVLCIAMFGWFFGALFQHVLLATKHYTGLIRNLTIIVIANLAINLVFIPRYGFMAAATTTAITECSMLILSIVYARQALNFRPKLRGGFTVIVATIVMTLAVYGGMQWLPSVETFATAPRLAQLAQLAGFAVIGAAAYILTLMLWGKKSPLWSTIKLLRPNHD